MIPILIMMTDGEGTNEDKAVEMLKDLSLNQLPNLITFAIGYGNKYKLETLQKIAKAGNLKSKYDVQQKKPYQEERKDYIIKIGKENLSLVIQCRDA